MSKNMNLKLNGIGRLASDPKLNQTANGKYVTTIRLAIENDYLNPDGEYGVKFYNMTFWNYEAKKAANCHKGDLVEITGTLDNKQKDGKDNIEIIGDEIKVRSRNKSYEQTLEKEEEIER